MIVMYEILLLPFLIINLTFRSSGPRQSLKQTAECHILFDNEPLLVVTGRDFKPGTRLMTVKELRWSLFKEKQAQSDRLPPTQAALHQAILRAHYQLMVWNSDRITNPELPSPQHYGWRMDQEEWVPVMTNLPPAPEGILQLVQCGCSKERCSTNRCQCRKAGLNCTDLCNCSDNDETCDNEVQEEDVLYSDEEDSSDSEMYIHE